MERYTAGKIRHDFWAVVTPSGGTAETLSGPGAEARIRAIVAERNAELDEELNPPVRTEHDRHQHGGMIIDTQRRNDGTIVVRIYAGKEKLEVHQYAGEVLNT